MSSAACSLYVQVLLKFKNLAVLYLHGNCITKLTEVNKLKVNRLNWQSNTRKRLSVASQALLNLQKLSLHGNAVTIDAPGPIAQKKTTRLEEQSKFYRLRIIYELR